MILDSSALVAILTREFGWDRLLRALVAAERRAIAAPTWLELCMVVDKRGDAVASARLETVLDTLRIDVVPFSLEMARVARAAFARFGRGAAHPARLNYGDCMAYALAKLTGETLLFKGEDFIRTDVTPALT